MKWQREKHDLPRTEALSKENQSTNEQKCASRRYFLYETAEVARTLIYRTNL